MNYTEFFNGLAKTISGNVDPLSVGKDIGQKVDIGSVLSQNLGQPKGSIAGRQSDRLLDRKDHFPVTTTEQAQSSMTRVLQLDAAPDWYSGSVSELKKEVYQGVLATHPDIQLNIRLPVDQVIALSDGTTPPTSTSIKNPEDCCKKDHVPSVKRPTLTSAELLETIKTEADRKAFSGKLMEVIEEQLEKTQEALMLAERLGANGITGDEFNKLATYVQQDLLYELLYNGVEANITKAENRRRELIEKMKNQ